MQRSALDPASVQEQDWRRQSNRVRWSGRSTGWSDGWLPSSLLMNQDESSGSRAARRQNRTIILLYWPSSGKTLRYAKGQKISPIAD